MWAVDCPFISTIIRITRREGSNTRGSNTWGRIFLEMLVVRVPQEWDIWCLCPPQMGKGAQRHFFTVLPAEGTIGPCWRQVTWKLGGFAELQNRRAGVAAVQIGGHGLLLLCVLRWQEMFASPQSCSILWMTVHEAKAKPSLGWGRVMVAPAASLNHLLHQDVSVLSTHTRAPEEKGKWMLSLPYHNPCLYKPCPDLPSGFPC